MLYTFKNKDTGEVFDTLMSLAEREDFLKANPNVEQLIVKANPTIDPARLGRMKPADGFREVLRKIKKAHPGSTIDTW